MIMVLRYDHSGMMALRECYQFVIIVLSVCYHSVVIVFSWCIHSVAPGKAGLCAQQGVSLYSI
jgi:hypothetical protein